jgi:hypothetical protein
MERISMAYSRLSRPFVAAQPPLYGGEIVFAGRPAGVPAQVCYREGRGYTVRIGEGANCYVVKDVALRRDAIELAMTMPSPGKGSTHTVLAHICKDGHLGHIVRVISGESLGWEFQPGAAVDESNGRPNQFSYHRAAGYGDPDAGIATYAFDLRFFARVYDEQYHFDELTGRRPGVLRSTWLVDSSKELKTNRINCVFVRRERSGSGPVPQGSGQDEAGTVEEPVQTRDDPIYGPVEPLSRRDLSPSAEANYRYVSEADDQRRGELHEKHLREAVKAAWDVPISFADPYGKPWSLKAFRKTVRTWRIEDEPASPYADPEGVSTNALVYGQEAEGDDNAIVLFEEFYHPDGNERSIASRYHLTIGDRRLTVRTRDVAEGLIYLRAQGEGDPRVSTERPRLTLEELAAAGEHHGHGFTSFSFPQFDGMYLRIEDKEGGFLTEFGQELPTVEEALRSSYERFMEALFEDVPVPAP